MKYRFLALLTFLSLGMAVLFPVYASAAGSCPPDTVFGIPAWYKGMQNASTCEFQPERDGTAVNGTRTAIKIGMNVLQAALVVAGYAAIIMLIRGGYMYMLSAGAPDGISSAKKTIRNAIIGLVIALLAAAIVNAVAGVIK